MIPQEPLNGKLHCPNTHNQINVEKLNNTIIESLYTIHLSPIMSSEQKQEIIDYLVSGSQGDDLPTDLTGEEVCETLCEFLNGREQDEENTVGINPVELYHTINKKYSNYAERLEALKSISSRMTVIMYFGEARRFEELIYYYTGKKWVIGGALWAAAYSYTPKGTYLKLSWNRDTVTVVEKLPSNINDGFEYKCVTRVGLFTMAMRSVEFYDYRASLNP